MNFFTATRLKRFFIHTFFIGFLFAASVYTWVRILLHDIPFELGEDILILAKMILTGWSIVAAFKAIFHLIILISTHYRLLYTKALSVKYQLAQLLLIIMLMGILSACSAQPAGVKKDLNTGMITTYKGITAEETKMVMNDEILNHNDIPLGESFYIINEKVKGLIVKDGKVSVGCSLLIADKQGKVLLSEPDLFRGNDVFEKDKTDYLRCLVNTGKPMNWEEKYNVTIIFTDKYGKGKIENKVTIRAIDIP